MGLGHRLMPLALRGRDLFRMLPGVYSNPSSGAATVWTGIIPGEYRIAMGIHQAVFGNPGATSATVNGTPLVIHSAYAGINSRGSLFSGVITVASDGVITSQEVTSAAARDGVHAVLLPANFVFKWQNGGGGDQLNRLLTVPVGEGDAIVALAAQCSGGFTEGIAKQGFLDESVFGFTQSPLPGNVSVRHPSVRALMAATFGPPWTSSSDLT